MNEPLGIATELAERRARIAAAQSPRVRANLVPTNYIMSGDVKRLTAENGRLQAENARLSEEVDRLRETVNAFQNAGRWSIWQMPEREMVNRVCTVIAKHYGIHARGIIEQIKERPFVRARDAAALFLTEKMGLTKAAASRCLRRDHHTIDAAMKRAAHLRLTDPAWLVRYEDACAELVAPGLKDAA